MNIKNMFLPLLKKESLLKGIIGAAAVALTYPLAAILVTLLTTRPLPDLSWPLLFAFAALKTKSQLVPLEIVVFVLVVVSSLLLFANYSYWKCRKEVSGKVGLAAGLFALVCPACILPVIGLVSLSAVMLKVTYALKLAAIVLILFGTYWVANKKVCKTTCKK